VRLDVLRATLLQNWGLKLLSLGFAVLLWMYVVGENRSEVSLSLPLELTRVPSNMVNVSRVPEAIRVRLNGPRSLLAGVNPAQIVVRLDLEGIQPGISGFEILPSRLNLPRGVEVTYISPSVITLEADVRMQKVIPVKPRIRGAPADGFQVAEARADPAQVEVEGAERALRQLKEVPTDFLDVSGLQGSVTRPVDLAFPDPTIRAVGKRTVKVEVSIEEMRGEREFVQVPVRMPAGFKAVPAEVNVRVEGSVRAVSAAVGTNLAATVEPFGAQQVPTGPVRVVVKAPEELRVIWVKPNVVEIVRAAEPAGEGAKPGAAKGDE
jgi:YbbR domain-containing protein